jgi:hypothetical protein
VSVPDRPTVSWFIQTAGVASENDYSWLAVGPDDPKIADRVVAGDVAGRPLLDFVSERAPSVLLGRRADGAYVLYANRLRLANAPAGDYMNRPISATVLGVAQTTAGLPALLDGAAAVLVDDLADTLPVIWTRGVPSLQPPAAGPWAPPARPESNGAAAPKIGDSTIYPGTDRARVATVLGGLDVGDIERFPKNRPLLVATDLLDVSDLEQIRPWLAITDKVSGKRSLKEGKWRLQAVVLAAAVVLLVVAWVVSRLIVRE